MSAEVELHLACVNCLKVAARNLRLQEGQEVPLDIEDAMEGGLFSHLKFVCARCESPIATVVGMKVLVSAF